MLGLSFAFLGFFVLLDLWLVFGWAPGVTRQDMLVFLKGGLEEVDRIFSRTCSERARVDGF